ncbi:inositol polyphosphate 5-phosphatase K-like [Sinocyclocheilus grahami]|uniref:inositol polyphosphate 5-phosphatase K-like n=1 Tax=Sinocyclocheilus grahami TaxID=75366 RepID=UPI0007ACDB8C|nr:PREDICTED: inositol polyphosphate 5-phosphatase K-like [Sinocyclocheilus grahami]
MEDDLSQALNSVSLEQKDSKMDTFGLYVVTWNVATAEPPDDVNSLLQLNSPKKTDLYVIGLQEVKAAPLKFVTDLAFEDSWSHLFMNTLAPLGYIKVSSIRMQGLLLLFFSKLEHVPFIRDIQVTYTRTGLYGYWGNKGGVSIRLSFYGHMLCFLNCHLTAHMNYASQRVDEFEYILDAQTFDTKNTPRILDHKVVFWFGDLNFRIEDHGMLFVRNCITSQRYNLLWPKDQLTMMKQKKATLQKFEEGPLDFQPTYKFDLNSDNYDTRVQKTWFGFNKIWVKDDQVSFTDELFQVYVNKDEIPVLGGECVLCYYSSNLQCIVGISQPFKVQESRAAIEEGLVPENINGLDETVSS